MATYEQLHGTRFFHPEWWKSWYDGPFRAQHLDPGRHLDYEARVRFMYEAYPPLVDEIVRRFRGQGRSVDRVFARSLAEQVVQMSASTRDGLLARGRRARGAADAEGRTRPALAFPIGLHVKDARVRLREQAVTRLLERGILRTEALVEAFLQVPPERYLAEPAASAMLRGETAAVDGEGEVASHLSLETYAMAFEALEPSLGDRVVDLTARSGYPSAVLSLLVGAEGLVLAVHPGGGPEASALEASLSHLENVDVTENHAPYLLDLEDVYDGLFIGAALPVFPAALVESLREPGGRAVAFLGPRFSTQDLVALTRRGDALDERIVARVRVPVLAGHGGWLRRVEATQRAVGATPGA
jgi:protein-L-isoaspartate O-methyltransferase